MAEDTRKVNGSVRVGPLESQRAINDPDEIEKHLTQADIDRLVERGTLEGDGWKGRLKKGAEPPTPTAPPAPTSPVSSGATSTPIPDDFPARAALTDAGIATLEDVRTRDQAGTLTDVAGIGDATADKIRDALK